MDRTIQYWRPAALGVCAVLLGCVDDAPKKEEVALNGKSATLEASCVELEEGQRILSVSPEGQLWTTLENGEGLSYDVDGRINESTLQFLNLSFVQGWDGNTLSLIDDGELWTHGEAGSEFVPVPSEFGRVGAFCGDPSLERATFITSETGLYERADGLWWEWLPPGGANFGDGLTFGRVDGACFDKGEKLLVLNDEGILWQVGLDHAAIIAGQELAVDKVAVASEIGIATLSGGVLALGPTPWREIVFEAGAVVGLSAGQTTVWALVGADVYARTSEGWVRVDVQSESISEAAESLFAHPGGGAWIAYSDRQVCHVELQPSVRVSGLRPFSHVLPSEVSIEVRSSAASVVLERDHEKITEGETTRDVVRFSGFDLGGPGWHTLSVLGADGEKQRELDYFVVSVPDVSWQDDILPIFQSSCTGSVCHGPVPDGTRVDLSSYEAWQGRASLIRTRLLRNEMPPIGPKLESEQIQRVSDWIEGGMKP